MIIFIFYYSMFAKNVRCARWAKKYVIGIAVWCLVQWIIVLSTILDSNSTIVLNRRFWHLNFGLMPLSQSFPHPWLHYLTSFFYMGNTRFSNTHTVYCLITRIKKHSFFHPELKWVRNNIRQSTKLLISAKNSPFYALHRSRTSIHSNCAHRLVIITQSTVES